MCIIFKDDVQSPQALEFLLLSIFDFQIWKYYFVITSSLLNVKFYDFVRWTDGALKRSI